VRGAARVGDNRQQEVQNRKPPRADYVPPDFPRRPGASVAETPWIAAGIVVTPERQQRVDFTSPLVTDVQQVIVTGANAPNLESLDDLRGQPVFANPLTVNYETLKRLSESS
jgi:hypothetical protein